MKERRKEEKMKEGMNQAKRVVSKRVQTGWGGEKKEEREKEGMKEGKKER